jgi:signal transduction histidine kinase
MAEQDSKHGLVARLKRLTATAAAALDEGAALEVDDAETAMGELEARVGRVLASLEAERAASRRIQSQFSELVAMVTTLAALDYDVRVTTYEGQDDAVNALAIGLNMMAEELKHTTEQLISARDEAMAANRAKSAFLANMSHELRTPLNAIIGYSELLCEEFADARDPAMQRDLQRITRAARHLLSLIQDTLDISKIEADKLQLIFAPVVLTELVDDLVQGLGPETDKRGNRLTRRGTLDPRPRLTDATRLRQVLLNLLNNANKFTHAGSITLEVRDDDEDGVPWVHFAVIDTGIGIPADRQERIFEAFTQAEESTARTYGGTGLGLTISRRLCEMLGGRLTLTSEVGVGSTFVASLPMRFAPP